MVVAAVVLMMLVVGVVCLRMCFLKRRSGPTDGRTSYSDARTHLKQGRELTNRCVLIPGRSRVTKSRSHPKVNNMNEKKWGMDGRMDGPTDGRTDPRTHPLIEMRGRI